MQSLHEIDLNLLLALDALLETASVGRSAQRLGLSSSGMSRALSRLRITFGDELLVRSGRSMERTPVAESLRAPLGRVLRDIEQLLRPGEFDPHAAWTVRTAGADYVEYALFPRLLEILAVEAPGVSLHHVSTTRMEEELLEGRLDCAVVPRNDLHAADLASTPLLRDHLVWVQSRSQQVPWTRQAYLQAKHVLVAPRNQPGGIVDERLASEGLERRVVATTTSFMSAAVMVARGHCVAALPEGFVRSVAKDFDLSSGPLPVSLDSFALHAFWAPRFRLDPAHRWFRGVLKRVAAEVCVDGIQMTP